MLGSEWRANPHPPISVTVSFLAAAHSTNTALLTSYWQRQRHTEEVHEMVNLCTVDSHLFVSIMITLAAAL
jgi:hypothetical protein